VWAFAYMCVCLNMYERVCVCSRVCACVCVCVCVCRCVCFGILWTAGRKRPYM